MSGPQTVTLNQIESHLWESANILLGPVNPSDSLRPASSRCLSSSESVMDIDEIVLLVRFPGWQDTLAGEREIKKPVRNALFKYKLHADEELFKRAYSYSRQYY